MREGVTLHDCTIPRHAGERFRYKSRAWLENQWRKHTGTPLRIESLYVPRSCWRWCYPQALPESVGIWINWIVESKRLTERAIAAPFTSWSPVYVLEWGAHDIGWCPCRRLLQRFTDICLEQFLAMSKLNNAALHVLTNDVHIPLDKILGKPIVDWRLSYVRCCVLELDVRAMIRMCDYPNCGKHQPHSNPTQKQKDQEAHFGHHPAKARIVEQSFSRFHWGFLTRISKETSSQSWSYTPNVTLAGWDATHRISPGELRREYSAK